MNTITTATESPKRWFKSEIQKLKGTHALTLNFTTARQTVAKEKKNMTFAEMKYEMSKDRLLNSSRWNRTYDNDYRQQLQKDAESIVYKAFLNIGQQLYGKRFYKKNNMNRAVVYEFGKREQKLHAHCFIDFSDYRDSDEQFAESINRAILKTSGVANNEYDLQKCYEQDNGYNWSYYITKHIDDSLSTVDFRNSTIFNS